MRTKQSNQRSFTLRPEFFWVREIPVAHTASGKTFFNPDTVIRVRPTPKFKRASLR